MATGQKDGERVRAGNAGLWTALAVGLAVRAVWLASVDTQPVTDFEWYVQRALSIAQGHGYTVDGAPTAYWPVGYPGFLGALFAAFGPSVAVGKVANTVLTLVSVALTWRLGSALFGSPRVATAAALLVALHPSYVAYAGILASEPLYTVLVLAGLCLLFDPSRGSRLVLAGLAFGLATLVRPQALLIPVVAVLCLRWVDQAEAYRGRAVRTVLTVVFIALAVVAPWAVRNTVHFKQPVFVSTNGGDNLLIGNSERSTGRYLNPDSLGYQLGGLNEAERDRAATRAALAYMAAHPLRTIRLWPAKVEGTFLTGTDAPYWAFQKVKGALTVPGRGDDKALFKAFRTVSQVATAVLLCLAGIGVLVGAWSGRLPVLGLALVGYVVVLSVVFFGNARFAFPVVPFLCLHACHGVALLTKAARSGRPHPPSNEGAPAD